MRPLIFKDEAGKQDKAAKQKFYREALAAGFTKDNGGVPAYRAALAAGKVTPPPSFDELLDSQVYEGGYVNKGWFGQKGGGVHREHKTHVASTNPIRNRMTLCGKFQEDVTLVATQQEATCGRCHDIKVTKPTVAALEKAKVKLTYEQTIEALGDTPCGEIIQLNSVRPNPVYNKRAVKFLWHHIQTKHCALGFPNDHSKLIQTWNDIKDAKMGNAQWRKVRDEIDALAKLDAAEEKVTTPLVHVWDHITDGDNLLRPIETALCGVEIPRESGVLNYRKATCSDCIAISKKKGRRRLSKPHTYGSKVTPPVKVAKPKTPVQRLRAAMRAVKFFTGMTDELFALKEDTWTHEDPYTRLLTLHGGHFPWTPPTKGYLLPPTEAEFQAQYDAAMKEIEDATDAVNAIRPTQREEATDRCEHIKIEGGADYRDEDCLMCFPGEAKVTQHLSPHGDKLDAVKAMAAAIYPSIEDL